MTFTIKHLPRPCSQAVVLCSFLSFWVTDGHREAGRHGGGFRGARGLAQRATDAAPLERTAHGGGVCGAQRRRRLRGDLAVGVRQTAVAAGLSAARLRRGLARHLRARVRAARSEAVRAGLSHLGGRHYPGSGQRPGHRHRWQVEPTHHEQGGRCATASGQCVCGQGGRGAGPDGDGGEVQRDHGDPRTAQGARHRRLHRHHRCDGHADQDRARHP